MNMTLEFPADEVIRQDLKNQTHCAVEVYARRMGMTSSINDDDKITTPMRNEFGRRLIMV